MLNPQIFSFAIFVLLGSIGNQLRVGIWRNVKKVKITMHPSVQSPCWVPVPAPGKFHASATGYLKYRASQRRGAIPADEKPIIFHCSLVAEISTPCIN
jgi:hypothetical protein